MFAKIGFRTTVILIYINDIIDELTGKELLYADDALLSYSSSNLAEIELVLNNDLNKIKEWTIKWLLSFNPVKT